MPRILAKFDGVCTMCGGITRQGEFIYWEKGQGAKHDQCPILEKSHDLEVDDDYSLWDDPLIHTYAEVQKIANCQKCKRKLALNGDRYYRGGDGVGFRAVCEAHT